MTYYAKLIQNLFRSAPQTKPVTKPIPTMPTRKSSVVASVLADLLSEYVINSIDGVSDLPTSRLKDHISTLRKRYGWDAIASCRIAKATRDGRVQWVTQYWIPIDVLDTLSLEQTHKWISEVRKTRRANRMCFKDAQQRAKACNARKSKVATTVKGKTS